MNIENRYVYDDFNYLFLYSRFSHCLHKLILLFLCYMLCGFQRFQKSIIGWRRSFWFHKVFHNFVWNNSQYFMTTGCYDFSYTFIIVSLSSGKYFSFYIKLFKSDCDLWLQKRKIFSRNLFNSLLLL